jgi:hypothetical protein
MLLTQGKCAGNRDPQEEKEESYDELAVLADGRGEFAAFCGKPDLMQRGIHVLLFSGF